jgi:sec-independent protein translocase protein TatB
MADSLILMVLALVVFGPRRLPLIGRQIGKLMYEFRKASNDFKFQMEEELRNAEEADRRKREEEERQRKLALTAESTTPAAATPSTEAVPPAAAADGLSQSPYPSGTTYPAIPAEQTPSEIATPAEIKPAEDSYPIIKPPSTGEPVAADKPDTSIRENTIEIPQDEGAEPTEAAIPAITPIENHAAAEEQTRMTEQATHNG